MEKIKIGGINYRILFKKNLEDNNQSVWGVTEYENATIRIREGLAPQKVYQTLLHESLHAMLHEAGLDDSANDESLVTPLGNMFYQFIMDNLEMLDLAEQEIRLL